jgi:hypothetical protein
MKNLFKAMILTAAAITSSQILAERSCHARDNSCHHRLKYDDDIDKYDYDGLASMAIRPVDLVLGDADVVRTITTPARIPADAVLPPWPYFDRD